MHASTVSCNSKHISRNPGQEDIMDNYKKWQMKCCGVISLVAASGAGQSLIQPWILHHINESWKIIHIYEPLSIIINCNDPKQTGQSIKEWLGKKRWNGFVVARFDSYCGNVVREFLNGKKLKNLATERISHGVVISVKVSFNKCRGICEYGYEEYNIFRCHINDWGQILGMPLLSTICW